MPCSRKEALTKLFFSISSVLKFLFIFFYLFFLFFAKLFTYFYRSEDEYDDGLLYEESEEEEEEIIEDDKEIEDELRHSRVVTNNHLVAEIVNGGEGLIFMSEKLEATEHLKLSRERSSLYENVFEDAVENFDDAAFYVEDCSSSDNEHDQSDDFGDHEVIREVYTSSMSSDRVEERFKPLDDHHNHNHDNNYYDQHDKTPCQSSSWQGSSIDQDCTVTIEAKGRGSKMNIEDDKGENNERKTGIVRESKFTRDGKFLIFDPPKSEAKKMQAMETQKHEAFEDTHTIGSTSKSSSDWRSSIRDSGTEDPFSSSSRRSCSKWESYTVYQKYDEEMIFLDRISAQKLHETESFRSFQVEPRSISQRIVHKLANKQNASEHVYKKSYNELEAAYVAQICLAWEALNWNYANFQRKQVSNKEEDPGCPAYIAQQFQQLQVLLQRYIENEPYERGRRPEIYARKRCDAPKLLQVPEYHDYEGEDKEEEAQNARITSASFLSILEESIQTYMNFLKADRKTHCQVLTALFKRRRKGTVDPAILNALKKHCKKKKSKLKELQRSCSLFHTKRKIAREEEVEILMALIDLEVVSRVLRMTDITQEQLQWCADKMGKVTLLEGRLQRDSSPLFFPAHSPTNNTLVVHSP